MTNEITLALETPNQPAQRRRKWRALAIGIWGPEPLNTGHRHSGLAPASAFEKGRYGVEQPESGLLRLQSWEDLQVNQFIPNVGHYLGDVHCSGAHLRPQLLGIAVPHVRADRLDPRPV